MKQNEGETLNGVEGILRVEAGRKGEVKQWLRKKEFSKNTKKEARNIYVH